MTDSPKSASKVNKLVCIDYNEQGYCKYGIECKFLHKDKDFKVKASLDYLIASQGAVNGLIISTAKELIKVRMAVSELTKQVAMFQVTRVERKDSSDSQFENSGVLNKTSTPKSGGSLNNSGLDCSNTTEEKTFN